MASHGESSVGIYGKRRYSTASIFINSGPQLTADIIADMGAISDDGTDDLPIPGILRRAVIQAFRRKLSHHQKIYGF